MNPIKTDPEIMHGTPCFAGTRVPVKTLFEFIEAGDSIGEFLRQFPTVQHAQVLAVLEQAQHKLLQGATAA